MIENMPSQHVSGLTPDHALTEDTKKRRRHLVFTIGLGLILIAFIRHSSDLSISGLLILKFEPPLTDVSVLLIFVLIAAIYNLLSFLSALSGDFKRVRVKFDGIRSYEYEDGRNLGIRGSDWFKFEDRNEDLIQAFQSGNDQSGGTFQGTTVSVETEVGVRLYDLFISDLSYYRDRCIQLHEYNPSKSTSRDNRTRRNLSSYSPDEIEFCEKLKGAQTRLILRQFSRETNRSAVWWFEIWLPIIIGMLVTLALSFHLFFFNS
jgi:hypothetical protein